MFKLKKIAFFWSLATDAGHATEGAVEEDLTDNDSSKDPIFMPRRQDIDSDDFNPTENMPTNDTDQSNFDVSELFKTRNLQSKEAREVEGSRNIDSLKALADHIHSKRLDTRQPVYGDENCFFSTAWLYAVNVVYAFFLRMQLCKHKKDKLHVDQ